MDDIISETSILLRCKSDLFEKVDFFLGAGASISSGIPSGRELVTRLKKLYYTTKEKKGPVSVAELDEYFNNQDSFPKKGADSEYSFYFEKCFENEEQRDAYIQNILKAREPSSGYKDLAAILSSKFAKTVWTTNFDNLILQGLNKIGQTNFREYSNNKPPEVNQLRNNEEFPTICRLHGDIKYDHTKNTRKELDSLETPMEDCFKHILTKKALFVIGYSGIDNSIMSFFEKNINDSEFLSKGLYWFNVKNGWMSERVKQLLSQLKSNGKPCGIVEIDSFDDFMEHLKNLLEIKTENFSISSDLLNIKEKSIPRKVHTIYKPNLLKKDVLVDDIYEKSLYLEQEKNEIHGVLEFQKYVINSLNKTEWMDFPNILLEGISGIGKTTEMKLLYNKIIDDFSDKTFLIPVFLDMQNYTSNMFNLSFFPDYKYLLFIDGFEEFTDSCSSLLFKDIKNILSQYKNTRIIISGRSSLFFEKIGYEYKFYTFVLRPYLDFDQKEIIKLNNKYDGALIKNFLKIPIFRNIAEDDKIDTKISYEKQYDYLLNKIFVLDKNLYCNAYNISKRIENTLDINDSNVRECLISLSQYLFKNNKLFFSENELYKFCLTIDVYEFLLKSSLFNYLSKDKIEFVSIHYFYYFLYFYINKLSKKHLKTIFFDKNHKIKEKRINLFYNLLKISNPADILYKLSKQLLGHSSLIYVLLTDFTYISADKRYYFYNKIIEEYNTNKNLIYYGRFEKSHDLLRDIDSLSDSLHRLLPKEYYNDAVKNHIDVILSYIENPTVDKITSFENAVILLGVHDIFWTENQYQKIQDISIPLIKFFREHGFATRMKGLLSEDIILSWYEDYGWTAEWKDDEWKLFFKQITKNESDDFYSFKSEDEFRLKLKFFIHFHKNIYIRSLIVPLAVKILGRKDIVEDGASFVPRTLDDDFYTPTIHFDNDISYFTFTIENYEISISDILYILNSVGCDYIHHNTVYQLEELYRKFTSQLENRITQLSDETLPEFYKFFTKYINTDDGMYISDFNKYIKLLNDNQKIKLFDLLLNDLIKNKNWQKLWMLHQSIVILLDIQNIKQACLLSDKLKDLDRCYAECIANIYVGKLDKHPLYETALTQYPILYPETVKKEEKRQSRLLEIETKIHKMQEKEIDIITKKEDLLEEVQSIFNYIDETQDISNRDTDRGNLLDLQTDYIYNKVQYDYKDYNIPPIFSSFAIKFLFNSTDENQKLNREETLKNIEDWFSSEKYFWRYFFWLFICHYKKEESDKFLEDNPVLIEKIKESMEQEVSYFIEENDISIYDGGRNRFWVVPFVHYLSRFYNNKLPDWFDKNKILNFIAYPAWQLSTGYGVHINGEFKWQSWDSVFDWIETVSGFSEDVIIEKALSLLSELKSDQSQTQVITVFVEKVKSVSAYKQQMLNAIIDKTIVEIQKDYKDHSNTSIMNGGALSSFWRETQEDFIERLFPYVDFSKYNTDDINYCRRSVFEYICKNVNEKQKTKIIDSLKNRISEKTIRIYLTKLGYDKAIILTINEFLNGENFNTDYAFYSSLFGKSPSSLRLLNKYFQLYEYSLEKKNDRRDYLIGYAKEGILQTTTKTNFWFIKKKLKQLIKRLKKESRYFEGVEDFLNEIEQRSFDDD